MQGGVIVLIDSLCCLYARYIMARGSIGVNKLTVGGVDMFLFFNLENP